MSNYSIASRASIIEQKYQELNKEAIEDLRLCIKDAGGLINLTKGDDCYGYVSDLNGTKEVRVVAVKIAPWKHIAIHTAEPTATGEIGDDRVCLYDVYDIESGGTMVVLTQTLHNIFEKLTQMY